MMRDDRENEHMTDDNRVAPPEEQGQDRDCTLVSPDGETLRWSQIVYAAWHGDIDTVETVVKGEEYVIDGTTYRYDPDHD